MENELQNAGLPPEYSKCLPSTIVVFMLFMLVTWKIFYYKLKVSETCLWLIMSPHGLLNRPYRISIRYSSSRGRWKLWIVQHKLVGVVHLSGNLHILRCEMFGFDASWNFWQEQVFVFSSSLFRKKAAFLHQHSYT